MKFLLKLFIFVLSFATISLADIKQVKDNFFNSLETFLDGNFEHTDFTIRTTEETKPELSIQTFKPLNESDEELTFFQGSFFMHDGDRETLNLGLGKRYISEDETTMYGLNAFYDHELDYDHSRMSLGGEIKSSYLELNYNQYFSNSDSKTGKNSKAEEALDGHDLEFGVQIPYIPSSTFYTKSFSFDVPGGNDFEGYEYTTKLEVPNSGLTLELGHTDYDHHNDQSFINLRYSNSIKNPGKSLFSSEAFERISMKDRMYEKVRRENIIKKKGAGFTVKAGGF